MVRTATSYAEASSCAAAHAPDFLVVEQWLSDGSGFELFTRLRRINSELVGVILTRHASTAAAVQAIKLGFLDYVPKPLSAPRLLGHLMPTGDVSAPVSEQSKHLPAPAAQLSLARLEWEHIHLVLRECCGNVSRAARELGLPRRSLQRKLRRNGPPPESPGRSCSSNARR